MDCNNWDPKSSNLTKDITLFVNYKCSLKGFPSLEIKKYVQRGVYVRVLPNLNSILFWLNLSTISYYSRDCITLEIAIFRLHNAQQISIYKHKHYMSFVQPISQADHPPRILSVLRWNKSQTHNILLNVLKNHINHLIVYKILLYRRKSNINLQ